ncbi:phospholipase D family protein [Vibrio atypicus]|uniref:phospholipase D family protein n=1 Tax=Vibrio atypicus TaxID=558271 RepID=UPI0013580FC4|nr:phospholipase D family protein [Vibrio atypicus]
MPKFRRLSSSLLLISVLTGCGSLPSEVTHTNQAPTTQQSSTLSKLSDSYWPNQIHSEYSAVTLQETGWDALAQRLALIEAAEHTIDIQYYIWNSDLSGTYLASRLIAAANRGVHVRVMLDDINLNEREELLIALNSHPNAEIRVFNPIPTRRGVAKWLNVLGDFSRLNRRMHNKSFTVDGVFSVVGGRNIGDEYFDLSEEINFRDRDVLAIGAVVNDIQASFNQYWDSRWSYPVDLLGDETEVDLTMLNNAAIPQYKHYPELPQGQSNAKQFLTNLTANMNQVRAKFIYDQPTPLDEKDTSEPKATAKYLNQLASESNQEILLESAYLVFDDRQLDDWQELNENGVQIKALTNSMSSNDLVTNHSAYAGRRKEMLEHGIQLFELKPQAPVCEKSTKDETKCAPETGYGLHAKSAVFDYKVAAIGSFNFNLRSTYLNTESLLIIDDVKVAQSLAKDINEAMDIENSWYLDLQDGDVRWHSTQQTFKREPETGKWQRFQSSFLQLLPIEKYL